MAHTPGPWRVDPISPGIVRINNDPTCGILVGLRDNALLVAAAPDLLEAARAVLAKECLITTSAGYLEYRALEAAIAKAEAC